MERKESLKRCKEIQRLILIEKDKLSYLPKFNRRLHCLHYDSDCDICEDEDEDERMLDILYLSKVRLHAINTVLDLRNPPFWVTPTQRLAMYRRSLMYERIYNEAMDAIDELCRVPVWATSDDDLSDSSSDSSDSSA